jgi:hypothetical protein
VIVVRASHLDPNCLACGRWRRHSRGRPFDRSTFRTAKRDSPICGRRRGRVPAGNHGLPNTIKSKSRFYWRVV